MVSRFGKRPKRLMGTVSRVPPIEPIDPFPFDYSADFLFSLAQNTTTPRVITRLRDPLLRSSWNAQLPFEIIIHRIESRPPIRIPIFIGVHKIITRVTQFQFEKRIRVKIFLPAVVECRASGTSRCATGHAFIKRPEEIRLSRMERCVIYTRRGDCDKVAGGYNR